MLRLICSLVFVSLLSPPALAGDGDLHGTYRLVGNTVRILDTGEEEIYTDQTGYISYGADGRMFVILVRGRRPRPESVDKITDQQRADLFRSVVAYSGRYSFDGQSIEHQIDISWNEVYTGTTLRRKVGRAGNQIMLTTPPSRRSSDGRMSVMTLTFEKLN